MSEFNMERIPSLANKPNVFLVHVQALQKINSHAHWQEPRHLLTSHLATPHCQDQVAPRKVISCCIWYSPWTCFIQKVQIWIIFYASEEKCAIMLKIKNMIVVYSMVNTIAWGIYAIWLNESSVILAKFRDTYTCTCRYFKPGICSNENKDSMI